MTPEPLDLDAIRARADDLRADSGLVARMDRAALLAHIDTLTAKLDAARALHKPESYEYFTDADEQSTVTVCGCCQDWIHDDADVILHPCSTLLALDGDAS